MTKSNEITENPPRPAPLAKGRITAMQMLGIVSVTLFITTEVAAAAAAGVWGITGLLHLQMTGEMILAAIVAVPALYAIVKTARMAIDAETAPENN